MKKVFAVLAIVGMFSFVACGPKAEEATTESTENVEAVENAAAEAAENAATEVAAAADCATRTRCLTFGNCLNSR